MTGNENRLNTQDEAASRGANRNLDSNVESRQVAWWPVHLFLAELTAGAGRLPIAGTPAWGALDDGDARKLLALAVAGEHHVLRVETAQEAAAEASRGVAAAADWTQVARDIAQRHNAISSGAYIRRAAS